MLAKASRAILFTTTVAFLLWMLIIDQGFLAKLFPDFIEGPMGVILASFYSVVVTALASAGKIR